MNEQHDVLLKLLTQIGVAVILHREVGAESAYQTQSVSHHDHAVGEARVSVILKHAAWNAKLSAPVLHAQVHN